MTIVSDAYKRATTKKAKKQLELQPVAQTALDLIPMTLAGVNVIGGVLRSRVQYISKHQLHVEKRYQRREKSDHHKKIAAGWDPLLLDVLLVNFRDGKYFIIDGQHRWLAAKDLDYVDELPCFIFHLAYNEEAKLFGKHNSKKARRAITRGESIRADIEGGDAHAAALSELMRDYGFTLCDSEEGLITISCTSTIENAYEINQEAAAWVLNFLRTAVAFDMRKRKSRRAPAIRLYLVDSLRQLYNFRSSRDGESVFPVRENATQLAEWLGDYGIEKAHEWLAPQLKRDRPRALVRFIQKGRKMKPLPVDESLFDPLSR